MKKFIFTILVVIIFTISCKTLKPISLNDKLKIYVPIDSKKITLNEIPYKVQDNREKLIISQMENFYLINNILIGLRTEVYTRENQSNKTTLEIYKPQLYQTFSGNGYTMNDASIQNVGSNRFLIYNYQKGSIGTYYFYSDPQLHDNNVVGLIRYGLSQKKEAVAVLKEVLKKVEIKI